MENAPNLARHLQRVYVHWVAPASVPVWRASARQQSDKHSAAPGWRTTALGFE
jgi:hypothetical protein